MEQEMLQRLVTNAVREMRLPSRPEGRGSHVLTLVDAVLDAALDEEATDIHLEPMEEGLRIRVRVDGLLRAYPTRQSATVRRMGRFAIHTGSAASICAWRFFPSWAVSAWLCVLWMGRSDSFTAGSLVSRRKTKRFLNDSSIDRRGSSSSVDR